MLRSLSYSNPTRAQNFGDRRDFVFFVDEKSIMMNSWACSEPDESRIIGSELAFTGSVFLACLHMLLELRIQKKK